jgi:hypothetical protein
MASKIEDFPEPTAPKIPNKPALVNSSKSMFVSSDTNTNR